MQSGIVESGYGSDPVGLVRGSCSSRGSRRGIPSAEAAWLQRQDAADAEPQRVPMTGPFLWLHFNLSHSAASAG